MITIRSGTVWQCTGVITEWASGVARIEMRHGRADARMQNGLLTVEPDRRRRSGNQASGEQRSRFGVYCGHQARHGEYRTKHLLGIFWQTNELPSQCNKGTVSELATPGRFDHQWATGRADLKMATAYGVAQVC